MNEENEAEGGAMPRAPRGIVNAWDQLRAAGGGVYIGYTSSTGRGGTGKWWAVLRVDARGYEIPTDPEAHWTRHKRKSFELHDHHGTHAEQKKAALAAALAWATAQFGVTEWARNRRGDHVPVDVDRRFPLPRKGTRR